MKALIRLLAVLIAVATGGCALTQMSSSIKFGGATLRLPKDATIGAVTITYPVTLTNGVISFMSITLSNCVFKNNPEAINAATAHDIGLVNAGGSLVLQAAGLVPKP